MAIRSLSLFLGQLGQSPEGLQIRILQIVFDMLMVHEADFLGEANENVRFFLVDLDLCACGD